MKAFSRARATYTLSLILSALLLVALALPAAAAKPDKAGKAKSSKATTTAVTEDNDSNDDGTPNNVVDDGDNRHPSGKDRSVERGNSGNQGKAASDPDGDSNGGVDQPDGSGGIDLADQDGNNGCGNDDDFEDDNNGNCGPKAKKTVPAPAPAEKPAVRPKAPEATEGTCTPGTVNCPIEAPAPSCSTDTTATCTDELSGDSGACGAEAGTCPTGVSGEVDGDAEMVDAAVGAVLGTEGELEGETAVAGVTVERSRPIGSVASAGGDAAEVGAADNVLAATGAPAVVLMLLALSGLGVGSALVRRTRRR